MAKVTTGFPRRLRETRESQDMSLDELAEQSGVDRATLWHWEHGSAPAAASLWWVAKALGVSMDYLWAGGLSDEASDR